MARGNAHFSKNKQYVCANPIMFQLFFLLDKVVFMGFLFGGYFWGLLADSIGRKKVRFITIAF